MKKLIVSFAIVAAMCFGCRPASAMDTCYKIEFEDNVFSFVAPETGAYTFKGGKAGTSPNGYLITVELEAGDVWIVPPAGDVAGAAISHVIICPTTPDPETPDCIHKDPAIISYGEVDAFKMHGRLLPQSPLVPSAGVTGSLTAEGATLLEFFLAPEDIVVRGNRIVGTTEQTRFRAKTRSGEVYRIFVRHKGEILESPSNQIVFDLVIGDQWFRVSGNWEELRNGWFLSNKNYICD